MPWDEPPYEVILKGQAERSTTFMSHERMPGGNEPYMEPVRSVLCQHGELQHWVSSRSREELKQWDRRLKWKGEKQCA